MLRVGYSLLWQKCKKNEVLMITLGRKQSGYDREITDARKAFASHKVVREMLSASVEPERIELFIIYFSPFLSRFF